MWEKHLELFSKHKKSPWFTENTRRAIEEEDTLDPELKALLYRLEERKTKVLAGD